MNEGTPPVACGNCGRVLDEERGIVGEEMRQGCPVCGSKTRAFSFPMVMSGGPRVVYGAAVLSGRKEPADKTPADQAPEAEEIRGRYHATLDWHRLDGNLWLLQVLDGSGDLVEGGIGDDPESALLEVYERLIPPT